MVKKLTLKDLEKTAQKRGGYCLAKEYKNSSVKIEWECSEGHIFEATIRDVRSGRWCPRCSQSFFLKKNSADFLLKQFSTQIFLNPVQTGY